MKNKGITLIALVITIVILIILAGVSISLIFNEDGIISKAQDAKEKHEVASIIEKLELAKVEVADDKGKINFEEYIDKIIDDEIVNKENVTKNDENTVTITTNNGDEIVISVTATGKITIARKKSSNEKVEEELNKANAPVLLTGMTPIKFTMPTDTQMGTVITNPESDWYEYGKTYETRRWANAKTQDGSMWVWIPRYAYKITYNDPNDITKGMNVDIVFLQGTTDNYYDKDGNIQTAKRCTSQTEYVDTTTGYTVHPIFTNESSINYRNGGWDKELTGIWVAKFEAGYASGNNNTQVVASNLTYTHANGVVWSGAVENGETSDSEKSARNWLDGIYGSTSTKIKYPVFQGTTYSMNYINHNDAFNISRALTDSGNIYGLNSSNADSHLMKDSEWGAVLYLSNSIYGQNGASIKMNNVNLNSGNRKRATAADPTGVDSVYAVTGCTSNLLKAKGEYTTISAIKGVSNNTPTTTGNIYVWNQKTGQNASTTGTIYGIYDLSGGVWERTSSYVVNTDSTSKWCAESYASSVAIKGSSINSTSTKYTTVYPNNHIGLSNYDTAAQRNFVANTLIYGDAIRETTDKVAGTAHEDFTISAINNICSRYPGHTSLFLERGGMFLDSVNSGQYGYSSLTGSGQYIGGFRTVLIAK